MFEYVNTTEQASLDGSAMDVMPFSLGFDQPTMSDDLDTIDWDNPDLEALAKVDWKKLHDEIMQEVFEDPAVLQPGPGDRERSLGPRPHSLPLLDFDFARKLTESGPVSSGPHQDQPHAFSPIMQATTGSPSAELDPQFVCDVEGCGAGPYKQRGGLTRHSRKHNAQQLLECPAVDCVRTGKKGFTRNDKLNDHMLAGHDEDTLFTCSICQSRFPRDIFSLHNRGARHLSLLTWYRTCPLPRCSYKVFAPWDTELYKLQHHLLEKHDIGARKHYTNLLEQKGYDARTCEVICPVCPSKCRFPGHAEFSMHFMHAHFLGPVCSSHDDGLCMQICYGRNLALRLGQWTLVPSEVRQARRAILRILPDFRDCYPAWEDIVSCGSST